MSANDKKQESGIERFFAISFGIVSTVSVIICLIGMVFCCVSYIYTSWKSSKEYSEVLQQISIITTADASQGISGDASPDLSSGNPPESLSDKTDMIETLIQHMESMVTIQKNGMTNDVMSFIYGMLSTLLVGLCAGFVVKSRANADDAKNTVDEAKSNAEIAKENAQTAAEKAKETEEAISQARHATEIATILKYQLRLIIISSRIINAKSLLSTFERISANREINQIRKEIESLFADKAFVSSLNSKNSDFSNEIDKVYNELTDLQKYIDTFLKKCRETYSGGNLESMVVAANNYKNWIDLAIQIINDTIVVRAQRECVNKSL